MTTRTRTTFRGQKKSRQPQVYTIEIIFALLMAYSMYHGPDMCLNYGFIVELAFHLTNL
jgi:hypothetical protein